jgi:MshEN domain
VIGRQVAEYLLEHGWVSSAQVEEARRTQNFFGGRLDSQLLRLGYVSEAALGEALTEVTGVPYASWEHLRTATPGVLDSIPAALVERLRICPFRLEEGRLRVATINPRDAAMLRDLQAATERVIEPWITTEPLLYQALERHYRIRFESTRPIRPAVDVSQPTPSRTRPVATDETPRVENAVPEMGLDGLPLDAEASVDSFILRRADSSADEIGASRSARASVVSTTDAAGAALDALDESLAGARDRDEIAEALFAFGGTRSSRCGLFAVGKDGIRGIAGRGRAFDTERLRTLTLPVGSGTVFDTALQSRDFYFGVVPALPANRDLYTALGGRLPANVMLFPIILKERTVALYYLDGDDGPLLKPDIPLMRRVAAKAGLAFEMLLLRNKLREI